jgi:hypothetical protein
MIATDKTKLRTITDNKRRQVDASRWAAMIARYSYRYQKSRRKRVDTTMLGLAEVHLLQSNLSDGSDCFTQILVAWGGVLHVAATSNVGFSFVDEQVWKF